jgi:hypothetical protein
VRSDGLGELVGVGVGCVEDLVDLGDRGGREGVPQHGLKCLAGYAGDSFGRFGGWRGWC